MLNYRHSAPADGFLKATGRVHHPRYRNVFIDRARALEKALPDTLRTQCELGFMHFEHENLNREYANRETMISRDRR